MKKIALATAAAALALGAFAAATADAAGGELSKPGYAEWEPLELPGGNARNRDAFDQ